MTIALQYTYHIDIPSKLRENGRQPAVLKKNSRVPRASITSIWYFKFCSMHQISFTWQQLRDTEQHTERQALSWAAATGSVRPDRQVYGCGFNKISRHCRVLGWNTYFRFALNFCSERQNHVQ